MSGLKDFRLEERDVGESAVYGGIISCEQQEGSSFLVSTSKFRTPPPSKIIRLPKPDAIYKDRKTCDAIIVTCGDHRFVHGRHDHFHGHGQSYQENSLFDAMYKHGYDEIIWPGGVKFYIEGTLRKPLITMIEMYYGLHEPKEILLLHHMECGAYANELVTFKSTANNNKSQEKHLEEQFHHEQLSKAAQILNRALKRRNIQMSIKIGYIRLSGKLKIWSL